MQKMVLLLWELIVEILLRLPIRSLVRFKCVCKSWFFLISDQHFAQLHFELADVCTKRLLFMAPYAREIRSIDINASLHNDSASITLKAKFQSPRPYNIGILGSCRGFLVVNCDRNIWVWNPFTSVHRFLYSSPMNSGYFLLFYGFGHDPSTNDYLVVQVFYNSKSHADANRAELFSLRANALKEIETTHYYKCSSYIHHEAGALLNGVIHWLAFSSDISRDVIATFDLTKRSFLNMSLPLNFECENFRFCHLVVLGGLLSLSAQEWHDDNHSVEIWMMKEYKVQTSWTRTISVSYQDYIPTRYFKTICSTKNGDIVGSDDSTILAKCNDKGEIQEHRSYCISDPVGFPAAVYTESLLSLPVLM